MECVTHQNEALNVALYVADYIKATAPFREAIAMENSKQLFLSWATKKPVTKQTLVRWLRTALELAGIDTAQFVAGLSAAHKEGASIEQIVKHGEWKGASTFQKFYAASSNDTTVGQIILNHVDSGEWPQKEKRVLITISSVLPHTIQHINPRHHSLTFTTQYHLYQRL